MYPIQYGWCPYKKRLGHRHARRQMTRRHQEQVSIYKLSARGLRREEPWWHLNLGLPASRTVKQSSSLLSRPLQSAALWQPQQTSTPILSPTLPPRSWQQSWLPNCDLWKVSKSWFSVPPLYAYVSRPQETSFPIRVQPQRWNLGPVRLVSSCPRHMLVSSCKDGYKRAQRPRRCSAGIPIVNATVTSLFLEDSPCCLQKALF